MKIRRLFSLGVIVLATVLVLTLGSGVASAAGDVCRGDPILYLSNGKTLLIDVVIDGVRLDNLSWIDYRVTLPKDVTLAPLWKLPKGASNNPEFIGDPGLSAKERVKIDSNGKAYEYVVEVKASADKSVRGSEVTVFTQIGWGKPELKKDVGSGNYYWDWPEGEAPGSSTIMQFSLGAEGKVGQTLRAKLFAQ